MAGWAWQRPEIDDDDAEREEVENLASGKLGADFRVRMEALPELRGRSPCWGPPAGACS